LATIIIIGVPVVILLKTPDIITAWSGSFLDVLAGDFPGRLRSNMDWIMRSSRGMFGGQPSMTTPTPFPWDSPHVVIFNTVPNVFPGIFVSLYIF
jgi:hypothetical protein